MRYQTVDGETRGRSATLREIALRLDYRGHTSDTAAGRRFGRVTIDLCDGDLNTFGASFTANQKSTPARVFSSSVTWPQQNGFPLATPAVWGGNAGEYTFPFTVTWLAAGTRDILSDWTFAGGTLLNSTNWPPTSPLSYYFDSYGDPINTTVATYRSIPDPRLNNTSAGVTGRCNDSAWGAVASGAYGYLWATVHGRWAANTQYRNKLVMYSSSYFTAPNAPVLHAWGFGTNAIGVDIGTGCNRLHINGPMFLQSFMVAPASVYNNGYSGYSPLAWPWLSAFANLKVTMQAAWTDSTTGGLGLTQAREATLPASAPPVRAALRSAIFSYNGGSALGPWLYEANPALRYR
jgi:hypothetical protein